MTTISGVGSSAPSGGWNAKLDPAGRHIGVEDRRVPIAVSEMLVSGETHEAPRELHQLVVRRVESEVRGVAGAPAGRPPPRRLWTRTGRRGPPRDLDAGAIRHVRSNCVGRLVAQSVQSLADELCQFSQPRVGGRQQRGPKLHRSKHSRPQPPLTRGWPPTVVRERRVVDHQESAVAQAPS